MTNDGVFDWIHFWVGPAGCGVSSSSKSSLLSAFPCTAMKRERERERERVSGLCM